jgi:hypothetical protein
MDLRGGVLGRLDHAGDAELLAEGATHHQRGGHPDELLALQREHHRDHARRRRQRGDGVGRAAPPSEPASGEPIVLVGATGCIRSTGMGSSVMWQMGHSPGSGERICGCIGQ